MLSCCNASGFEYWDLWSKLSSVDSGNGGQYLPQKSFKIYNKFLIMIYGQLVQACNGYSFICVPVYDTLG